MFKTRKVNKTEQKAFLYFRFNDVENYSANLLSNVLQPSIEIVSMRRSRTETILTFDACSIWVASFSCHLSRLLFYVLYRLFFFFVSSITPPDRNTGMIRFTLFPVSVSMILSIIFENRSAAWIDEFFPAACGQALMYVRQHRYHES